MQMLTVAMVTQEESNAFNVRNNKSKVLQIELLQFKITL